MQFRTQIPISKAPIDYNVKMVSLGSCFAENISSKTRYCNFRVIVTIWDNLNPVSQRLINRVVSNTYFTEDVFFYNENWHCYELHRSCLIQIRFLFSINELIDQQGKNSASFTDYYLWNCLGLPLAWKSEIVANCHKYHKKEFDKELLSIPLIELSISNMIAMIRSINPSNSYFYNFASSSYQGWFVQNQLSKSHLFTALHAVLT
jgi:hypothetical protein